MVILNTKWKDCKSCKTFCTKNFTYTKKFYVHEIAAVDLSKIYFLKNAKKTWFAVGEAKEIVLSKE